MNIKKVGLTALAASLVSVSANAGAVSVAGSASMNTEGHSGTGLNAGTTFSMSNQLTFSGSGELDNGLNVSISFVLDQGDNETDSTTGAGTAPFDSHSVTVSSDELGSLTLAGEGGNSATTKIDTTAAGDLWDNFDQLSNSASITFVDLVSTEGGRANNLFYSSPDMSGFNVTASYEPQGGTAESATSYGVNYTGIEGLSLSYATTDVETGTASTSGDNTVMKASYAYGPVTVSYSNMEHDEAKSDNTLDIEMTSYAVSYTVSDDLSVTYGSETSEKGSSGTTDAEIDGISVSYTTGGMTISASMVDGENLDYSTSSAADVEYWALGASFAF